MGYAGGEKANPTYHDLGDHTESIEVVFDPKQVSYEDLLKVFWTTHNPERWATSRQYASLIFYHNEEQRKLAVASKAREEERRKAKLCTDIVPAGTFWVAEGYHQKYYLRSHPDLLREFRAIYPKEADFVASTAVARVNGYVGGSGAAEQLKEELPRLGLSAEAGKRLLELAERLPSPTCK
ncbi:MAG: peptide-methionine (S)-S-oxide reductase [Planctomycetes bacterium]|nr:peptide-methionine (S)-S-oxide reductase [Planctomycetota bacterium]